MMKNAYYFTLKAIFVLKIFKFLSWGSGQVEKRLHWKDKIVFKVHDVTTWEKTITMYILPNISRSKGNWTMKFDQLIEYNMGNIFLGKSYSKCCGETIPRPFPKNSKLSIFLNQYSKVSYSLILMYAKLRAIDIFWN